MIVANIKSPQDLQSKKTLQSQLLALEVANEAEQERRVRDYKNPNRPIPIAPEYKTNAELQKDRLGQERQAIANMEELGFDYTKSAELVSWLSSSLINRLVEFNANFKGIKKELTETTNPKLLNSEFLKNYLEKYFEDIDINFGRKFNKEAVSGSATPSSATLEELQAILPDNEMLNQIANGLTTLFTEFREDLLVVGKRELSRVLDENRENYLSANEVRDLSERERNDYQQRIIETERRVSVLRKNISEIESILKKIGVVRALLKLYIVVLPPQNILNLFKQSLTQQERADLLRRYMVILQQLRILSNSGTNELFEEFNNIVGKANEFNEQRINDLKLWLNKATKALAFISNESGISKISKLQRDYQVVLSQSGKVGEYERLKQYNDIVEREIAEGLEKIREVLKSNIPSELQGFAGYEKNSLYPLNREDGDDEDGFLSVAEARRGEEARGRTIRLADMRTELKAQIRKEILQRDPDMDEEKLEEKIDEIVLEYTAPENKGRARREILRDERKAIKENVDLAEIRRKYEERYTAEVEGLMRGVIEDQRYARLPNIDERNRTAEFHNAQIAEIQRLQREFIDELVDIYRGNSGEDAVLKDMYMNTAARLSNKKKKTPAEKAEEADAFKKLETLIGDAQKSAINTAERFVYNSREYFIGQKQASRAYTEIADTIQTRGGDSDDKYFARLLGAIRDLGELKINLLRDDNRLASFEDGSRILDDYDPTANLVKASIKSPRGGDSGRVSTYGLGIRGDAPFKPPPSYGAEPISDDEGKGGCGLGFRHKKIKVGRGITATETPSYLSFGKYVIHMGHLLDKNIANFKYPSLGSIPSIKPLTIGDDYKEFILDTLDNQKPNERLFNKLSAEEQKHFERVVSGAGLVDTFKLKRNRTEQEKKDNDRFELLRGEVMAGNNSEKVLKELRGLIVRFINEGRIHQREGTNMLMEISAI